MPGLFVPARGRLRSSILVILAAVVVGLSIAPALAASRPAIRAEHAVVVSPETAASEAGLEVLRAGGNAIDGAVATALALAVTYPVAGNLGGGGFLLYRSSAGEHLALDFRESAPRKLRPESFLDGSGQPIADRTLRTGLAVGVPGTVAGLIEAHRKWGSRPWTELVAPAIRLAENGFRVPASLADYFERFVAQHGTDPEFRRVFLPDGGPPPAGHLLRQPDLALALRRVAESGAAGFYRGPTAAAIEQAVAAAGGVLDRKDLRRYRPIERDPIEGSYRGYRIVSFPPPSSGGIVLLQILGMLEPHDLGGWGFGSSRTVHVMAEAERRAYADRSEWLGDPAFHDVPVAELLAPDYLRARAAGIRLDAATPSDEVLPGVPTAAQPHDTLHFSVADGSGGAVSLTTTLNTAFGTGIVAPGTGILLNNEIDDFALAPGVPNTYGLLGGEANAVAPDKRPLSSMTPTIVECPERGKLPCLVLGSPGGSTIITSVLQVLVNVIDHDMPIQEAVDAPRFHHQWYPDVIRHEARTFPEDVAKALRRRGHTLEPVERTLGNVNAIAADPAGGWLGAPDPRRDGHAAAY